MTVQTAIPQREVRRSFTLGVFNGAAFEFAERLIDPPLILTWFVNQLTSSNLLIGMVAPLGTACWLLPQIFVSARIQRMPVKMPSYFVASAVRITAWLSLVAALWFLRDPRFLLVSFFVLYALARLGGGLGGLAFFDVVAKTIPARRRGSFFAWRQLAGGLLSLGAGAIAALLLDHPGLPFPHGHAMLFLLYCAVIVPALGAFIAIHEPAGTAIATPVTPFQQVRRALRLLPQDPVFRRFTLIRWATGLAGIGLPFYGIYARNALGAPAAMVGVYIAVRAAAQLLFNLPWGRLSDDRGNRLVLQLSVMGSGLTASLALILVLLTGSFRLQGGWLPYLVVPLFFLDGALRPTQTLVGSNFLIEFVPEEERPLYLGFGNTLYGVVVLLSGLGGLVVDLMGFTGLFTLTIVLYGLAYVWTLGLPEPRRWQNPQHTGGIHA
jgi:MFS family permease